MDSVMDSVCRSVYFLCKGSCKGMSRIRTKDVAITMDVKLTEPTLPVCIDIMLGTLALHAFGNGV